MSYTVRVDEDGWSNYETLLRPDGTELATLMEPEDRTWGRDLRPIVAELNALRDEVERLRVELARAKDPSVMSVLLWESFRENELKDVEAERDAALAEVERLRCKNCTEGPCDHSCECSKWNEMRAERDAAIQRAERAERVVEAARHGARCEETGECDCLEMFDVALAAYDAEQAGGAQP